MQAKFWSGGQSETKPVGDEGREETGGFESQCT